MGSRGSTRAESEPARVRTVGSWSHGSVRILKKPVPAKITGVEDILKQYVEMGELLGYDMESNQEKIQAMLASMGAVRVDP